jgi:hypothetical protein
VPQPTTLPRAPYAPLFEPLILVQLYMFPTYPVCTIIIPAGDHHTHCLTFDPSISMAQLYQCSDFSVTTGHAHNV